MVESIAVTLGAGSGIDTTALVTSLVDAQFSTKTTLLTTKGETLTTQLSAASKLKSAISGFSTALSTLTKSGTLSTGATSSNASVVTVTALAGAKLSGLSASVEVRSLATAQVSNTVTPLAAGTTLGTGTIQLAIGSYDDAGTFTSNGTAIPPITIGTGEDTLSGIAAKINAAKAGVTASVISDSTGERLVMKGATGAAAAFTLSVTPDESADGTASTLSSIEVGTGKEGTTAATTAGDARIALDGVEVRRATNSVSDLVPGVRLDLQSVAVGTKVTIGSTAPTEALRQAVNDVVDTYNELFAMVKEETNATTGSLKNDSAAREMLRALSKLTLTDLTGATDGTPKTLAELGVATARDGTLSVNATTLTAALTNNPEAVEKMFADGTGASKGGLNAALAAISSAVTSTTSGLGASEARYTKAQSTLATDMLKIETSAETMRTRLTQQYASMDARVAAYKATQAFLEQQVEAWNASSS